MSGDESDEYVLGHEARELERLERQAAFFGEMTRHGLERAGLTRGMRVLDLGCGVGDVSLIAADLVGPEGAVVGIDIAEGATTIATRRAQAANKPHVRFEVANIEAYAGYGDFDAVVGRFIVVHLPKPEEVLRRVVGSMKKGAILQFAELDFTTAHATAPAPFTTRLLGLVTELYRRVGREPDSGTRLYSLFRALDLDVELFGYTRVGRGREQAGHVFLAESVKSLLPIMEKVGLATAAELDPPTLVDRIAAEITGPDPAIFYPRAVVAWARVG